MFGYGSGTRTSHNESEARNREGERVASRFSNSMTAHAWAQMRQSFGASGNGNFYFRGRTLFSYGPHYAAGYIMPGEADPDGRGVALLNADTYSVSTSRHMSEARSAVIGRSHDVPGLTPLARLFDMGLAHAAMPEPGREDVPRGHGARRDAAGFYVGVDRAALARYLAPRLKAHFSDPDNVPDSVAAVVDVFKAAGCNAPERRARAALAAAERNRRKAEAREAREARDSRLADLAAIADRDPADVVARMESEAREAATGWGGYAHARAQWEDKGRRIFRAIKAGKAAGRSAQARKAGEVRKAIRANLWRFEAADERARRRDAWATRVRDVRRALRVLDGTESAASVRGGPSSGSGIVAKGAEDARALCGALAGDASRTWAAPAARLVGLAPAALASRLSALAGDLEIAARRLAAEERRAAIRRDVATLRAARDMGEGVPVDVAESTLKAAAAIADRYADRPADSFLARIYPDRVYTGPDGGRYISGHGTIPAAFRRAGWTGFRFLKAAELLKTRHKAAAAALADMVRNREAEARGRALALWRAGEPIPRELARFTPRAFPDGSVYIRARDVQTDAAGTVTGGTLETSQGATVPLAHAVRVFRFLKLCRDRGEGWTRNGRTLRVGLFSVDTVDAGGNFRAGCHKFQWEEVARLARELNLADVAPADATENKESA